MNQRVMSIVILCAALVGCSSQPDKQPESGRPPHVITNFAQTKQTQGWAWLSAGQIMQVRIQAQSGTGYAWRVLPAENPPSLLSLKQQQIERYGRDGRILPGGAEWAVFDFRADKPGKAELKFVYDRPFEKDAPPAKTYTLEVEVNP
jgi:inhibitor of cysteine peptidase